jgi:ATP-dependent DNA helicase RecQ
VVVSPLIALMKDQVDGLRIAGYPAAALHSGVEREEQQRVERELGDGTLKLLFVAPERLLTPGFLARLVRAEPGSFAIDEAHCISQWGHDFRPEYRRLAELRGVFPGAPLHAFTATATRRVQEDIVAQLKLKDAAVLVGPFDRPNLTYRVIPRRKADEQCAAIIHRHSKGEAAGATIIYCLSRKNTEELAAALRARSIPAEAYHAGLSAHERRRVQDDFSSERLDVVCATVAFGMGIDRSNVRCVIHATMPKSVEHYQQETGRAGRDGLAAECVLLYSPGDVARWRQLMERSAAETGASDESLEVQFQLLSRMQRFAGAATCRHRALAEYFGQPYEWPRQRGLPEGGAAMGSASGPVQGCGACDVCLRELAQAADATPIARKILSCVYRVGQSFGAAHVAQVLRGGMTERVLHYRHHELSTFALLKDTPRHAIVSYIDQLVQQGLLEVRSDPYPVIRLTAGSAAVLKGEKQVSLTEPAGGGARGGEGGGCGEGQDSRRRVASDDPLDADASRLFESLRSLRLSIARERGIPPYVVFHDSVRREIARARPRTLGALGAIKGVGQKKVADLGPAILEHISAAGASHE